MGLLRPCFPRMRGYISPLLPVVFLWILLLSLFSPPCISHRQIRSNGNLPQEQKLQPNRKAAVTSFSAMFAGLGVLPSHALSAGRAPGSAWSSSISVRGSNANTPHSSWFPSEGWGLFSFSKPSALKATPSAEPAGAAATPSLLRTTAVPAGAVKEPLQPSSSPASALAFVGGHPPALLRTNETKETSSSSSSSSSQQQPAGSAAALPAVAAARAPSFSSASLLRSSSSNSSGYSLDGDPIEGPLQPLRGMVLLQRREVQETSAGGVYLPSEGKDRQVLAKVLAVGPGELRQGDSTKHIPVDVQPGDWAVISRHSYDTVKYNGKECVLVAAADILAKVKDAVKEADPVPSDLLPLGDAVLVKVYKQPEKTASGLYLHPGGGAQSRTLKRGVVVAVGPGRYDKEGRRVAIEIQPGKNVLYPQYAQDEPDMKYGADFYAFVKAADVLAEW